jgi:hypothetical protein
MSSKEEEPALWSLVSGWYRLFVPNVGTHQAIASLFCRISSQSLPVESNLALPGPCPWTELTRRLARHKAHCLALWS